VTTEQPVLRVHLEGPAVSRGRIALSDLEKLAKHLQDALFRVGEVMLGGATSLKTGPTPKQVADSCTLEMVAVEPGSVELVLDLRQDEQQTLFDAPTLGEQALQRLVLGAEALRDPNGPLPHGYDTGVLCSWRDAGRLLSHGVDRLTLNLLLRRTQHRAVFDREVSDRVALRLQAPVHNKRTVEGRLLMGDFKESGYQCRIHPPVGAAVRCTFGEAHRDTVLGSLTKPVRVVGEAREKGGRISSLHIADIEALDEEGTVAIDEAALGLDEQPTILELAARQGVAVPGSFDALLGDFWPDDESSDDFVAAVREWRHEEPRARRRP